MDIAFAFDASGSVLMENYQRVKAFLKQLVAKFDISASGTHFAGLHYTSQVFIDFSFSNTTLYDVTNLQVGENIFLNGFVRRTFGNLVVQRECVRE